MLCSLGCNERIIPKDKEDHEKNHCANKNVCCIAQDVGCTFSGQRSEMEIHTGILNIFLLSYL